MRSADYTRVAEQLPAVYRDDADSFAQIDAYLGLMDELNHEYAQMIEDLAWALGPDAALHWPAAVPLRAGADALREHHIATYDTLARWFGFEVPGMWPRNDEGLARRRQFVTRASRIWRRRGTPGGFVDWFCLFFGVDESVGRPFLLEHHKIAYLIPGAGPFTATLLVPNTGPFHDIAGRVAAAEFARLHAPAHVALRMCFVGLDHLGSVKPLTDPLTRTDQSDIEWANQVAEHASLLRELLCTVVSEVRHADGLQVFRCPEPGATAKPRPENHLGLGRLPHPHG